MPHNREKQQMADRLTQIDDILLEQNAILQSILNAEGVASQPDVTASRPTPFEYAPIPETGRRLPLPAGDTTFNFDRGRVTHSEHGPLEDGDGNELPIRDFDDMSTNVENAKIQSLRSLYLAVDAPCEVSFNEDTHRFALDPAQYYPLKSQGFRSFTIHAEYPVEIVGVASTRASGFPTDSVQNHMQREADVSDGVHDSYTSLLWYPDGLADTLPAGVTELSEGDEVINAEAHNRHSFRVHNDSGNGNAIDAKVQAADTPSLDWYDIGLESTAIPDGDHTLFDTQQRHNYLRIQIRNNVNGNDVSAYGTMTGGS